MVCTNLGKSGEYWGTVYPDLEGFEKYVLGQGLGKFGKQGNGVNKSAR